jgi:hypothetical protein
MPTNFSCFRASLGLIECPEVVILNEVKRLKAVSSSVCI